MLSLIIAEASLELVPKELWHHNAVASYCKRVSKRPSEVLLDNSWHFGAMKGLQNEIKRGRPDIVHFCLLEACTIPLYDDDEIQVFVHTLHDKVIEVGRGVRMPKSYHRFAGIMEKLFAEKKITSGDQTLFALKDMTFSELVDKIKPDKVIGLSPQGQESNYYDAASRCTNKSCLVVGGFPKGDFEDSTKKRIDTFLSVEKRSLEAHVVMARTLYEYEKTIFM
ncbi:ribosome biogenesis protein [Candidatus Nitrosotenuis uzonensis]|uniref:Ribosomal RNA small subunit methyltransferase Nep1 n=1 Tax=Candidatus Nitrosotenuis uzonensis TaxID=1407055 RepID=A0A812F3S0_9ARCH|nr:ribosome biogenesis protein [Candidatus Nitrosotenuis uzonensis]CAE6492288.1 Ribosomal RNA small subunit methyltransferase Nep1 [Candidatus Nitrosotenuis uzonensis]